MFEKQEKIEILAEVTICEASSLSNVKCTAGSVRQKTNEEHGLFTTPTFRHTEATTPVLRPTNRRSNAMCRLMTRPLNVKIWEQEPF